MPTSLRPNGKVGHFDVAWSALVKLFTGVAVALLTAAVLGLFKLSLDVQRLTFALNQMHDDVQEVRMITAANAQNLTSTALEIEHLKAIYLTREEADRRYLNTPTHH